MATPETFAFSGALAGAFSSPPGEAGSTRRTPPSQKVPSGVRIAVQRPGTSARARTLLVGDRPSGAIDGGLLDASIRAVLVSAGDMADAALDEEEELTACGTVETEAGGCFHCQSGADGESARWVSGLVERVSPMRDRPLVRRSNSATVGLGGALIDRIRLAARPSWTLEPRRFAPAISPINRIMEASSDSRVPLQREWLDVTDAERGDGYEADLSKMERGQSGANDAFTGRGQSHGGDDSAPRWEAGVAAQGSGTWPGRDASDMAERQALLPGSDIDLWPAGVVPYEIDADFPSKMAEAVERAIGRWNVVLDGFIVLLPKTSPGVPLSAHYLRFKAETRIEQTTDGEEQEFVNRSSVGYETNVDDFDEVGPDYQTLWMRRALVDAAGSTIDDVANHEIGHALGLGHPQRRSDRDAWFRNASALRQGCRDRVPWVDEPSPEVDQPLMDSIDYATCMIARSAGTRPYINESYRLWIADGRGQPIPRRSSRPTAGDVSRLQHYYHLQRQRRAWSPFRRIRLRDDLRVILESALGVPCTVPPPDARFGLGLEVAGELAVTCSAGGTMYLACRASDGSIYAGVVTVDGDWLPTFRSFGATSSPAIAMDSGGRLHLVFAVRNGPIEHLEYSEDGRPSAARELPPLPDLHGERPTLTLLVHGGGLVCVCGDTVSPGSPYLSARFDGRWSNWASVDPSVVDGVSRFGVSNPAAVQVGFGSSGTLVAAAVPTTVDQSANDMAVRLYLGESLERMSFAAVARVKVTGGHRLCVIPPLSEVNPRWQVVAVAQSAIRPAPSKRPKGFPMLWRWEEGGEFAPIGGLPRAGTSPAAAVFGIQSGLGRLVFQERDVTDAQGEFLQRGGFFVCDFQ